MDNAIIAQMRSEEADLMKKLKAVRDFLAAYGQTPANEARPASAPTSAAKPNPPPAKGIDGYSDYGRLVVAESMRAMLAGDDRPMKSRQIVEIVSATGLQITGENKINALGALLYRSADITSHGKAGWTLKDREAAQRIVAEYGYKRNGETEASPDAEGAATPSTDNQGRLEAMLG